MSMFKPNEETVHSCSCEKSCRTPITELLKRGKVRNIHAFRGLIFEVSNRLSVFDRVIKEDVPLKGAMLNCISQFNKQYLSERGFPTDYIPVPACLFKAAGFEKAALGRLSYAEELLMLPFEFIVRGYLVGSAYKAYEKGESYCGFTFPDGLQEGAKLDEPIVSPTTDRPVTKEECIELLADWLIQNDLCISADDLYTSFNGDFDAFLHSDLKKEIGEDANNYGQFYGVDKWDESSCALAYQAAIDLVDKAYSISLQAYSLLAEMCEKVDILFIDTKFEFGINSEDNIVLADEVGTPDSSRFASAYEYATSGKIVSMDKQIVRDYCASIGFKGDEDQPIPDIPDEVCKNLTETYVHIAEILCGEDFVAKYK